MTQLVMGVNEHFLLPIANGIIGGIKALFGVFKRIGNSFLFAVALSRQTQANALIARHMIVEYPHHTVESLTHELNQRTIAQLEKEFARD